jgi:predicted short-subunit dehydrogenase-like oxidoreductase (DUF2520 family)
MHRIRIIGAGRAGSSLAWALRTRGVRVDGPLPRAMVGSDAGKDCDVLILAVPDDVIREVAATISPVETCVVMHCSGSRNLDVLAPHANVASLHPLIPMPNQEIGAQRLLDGATIAVSGHERAREIAEVLGGRIVEIPEDARARYHAAACIAANHVVALMGQVERIAASLAMSLNDFQSLATAALQDAMVLSPGRALTGPASRGDVATIERHVEALDASERESYQAMARAATRLAHDTAAGY